MSFDHGALDVILKAAVRDRVVDYGIVEKHAKELDGYLAKVATAVTSGDDDALALYINAYNARVLRSFIKHGKTRVVDVKGFFDAEREKVAGEDLTLNELEEKHIRRLDVHGIAKDPRVHFVVNCASRDCPPLAPRAYTAAKLAHDLEERTRAYLTRPGEVVVDEAGHRVIVVQIFEWYASDFAGDEGVRRFIAGYVSAASAKLLDDKYELDYRPYDWTPNAL